MRHNSPSNRKKTIKFENIDKRFHCPRVKMIKIQIEICAKVDINFVWVKKKSVVNN